MPAATVTAALQAMLNFYAVPGTWTSGSGTPGDVETALYEAVGDPDEPGIPEAEWDHRSQMICAVFDACGCDLAALGDVVRHQRAVVAVLRAGLSSL